MFGSLGWPELILLFIIVAMLFGVGKLPEVFGAVGKGIREFRKEAGSDGKPVTTVKAEQSAETGAESK
jgi:sec-independent protein translocase protein TatA